MSIRKSCVVAAALALLAAATQTVLAAPFVTSTASSAVDEPATQQDSAATSITATADIPPATTYWAVDDIREGMKGVGKTVLHGTEIVEFEVTVLGVQKNSSPGRDTVLVRLSGCELEHTGIIAGMSGSPVYIDGKLLGAVAFAWPFGKEPIGGVTPFAQMVSFAGNLRSDYLADATRPHQVSTMPDLHVWERDFRSSLFPASDAESSRSADRFQKNGSVLGMAPIKTPLMMSGFQPRTLDSLAAVFEPMSMMPVGAGKVSDAVMAEAANQPLQPGSPLSVSMVTGDFDISGIGTVTHIQGDRVYGFGHPMFSLGKCEFPLNIGYIHVVFPRQTVSFKIASPLKPVGVIDTDVSTCIAGRIGGKARMVPMEMTIRRAGQPEPHRYKVEVVRQRDMLASMVYSVLAGSIDTEGNLPEELTVRFQAAIKPRGRDAVRVNDVFSGEQYSGANGPLAIYSIVPNLLNILAHNPYEEVDFEYITCDTEIIDGRSTANIDKLRLRSEVYQPGDKLVVSVELDPFKGGPQRVECSLDLPANLPPGQYQVLVCDAMSAVRSELRNRPYLFQPQSIDHVYRVLGVQLGERRNNLYMRVMTRELGVAMDGEAMPNLPLSMAQLLTGRRRSGTLPIRTELVSKTETPFVIQGAQTIPFTVVADKKLNQ